MQRYTAQVIIIGGGATGVGLLRDLSLRGVAALLLEQGDLAHGTSSRFHGLLHSGARYAVKDPLAAAECVRENEILNKVAPHCVRATGGWFVELAADDPSYTQAWLAGCSQAGIPVQEISPVEACRMEPMLTRQVRRVFEVPDAAVDGFQLVWANARAAAEGGASYKTYHRVEKVLRRGHAVSGVYGENVLTHEKFLAEGQLVVNATGAWAAQIAAAAGASLEVICDKGTLLAFNQRLCQRVINRLRVPGDGDIFVPHETITIFGTTSELVQSPRENEPTDEEADYLLSLGADLLPHLAACRVIRAFAGVRPLHADDRELGKDGEEGREVSRNFALIDHGERDGIEGLLSIVGGKFTTYRLMAEKAADWAAAKLGVTAPCRTAEVSLAPHIPEDAVKTAKRLLPAGAAEKMVARLGPGTPKAVEAIQGDPRKAQLLCECEMVTVAEVEQVAADGDTHHLADVRRKTRLGMGTCQGAFCTYRALQFLRHAEAKPALPVDELTSFLNQRWKGIRPVAWGPQLRETELTRAIYLGLLDLGGN